ncbi:MAG: glycosyltransferase, partial [Desulfarculaceae bacterium]
MNKSPLHIGFVTDGEPFDGASPEERALGGSETAMVQIARALCRRGHEVQVFCRCPRPGMYQGVRYRHHQDLVRAAAEERFSVLVVSRFSAAFTLPLQAGLRVLWNHDILDKPAALKEHLDQVDICLVLSRFHAWDYTQRLPECAPKLVTTRNGLDLPLLAKA